MIRQCGQLCDVIRRFLIQKLNDRWIPNKNIKIILTSFIDILSKTVLNRSITHLR